MKRASPCSHDVLTKQASQVLVGVSLGAHARYRRHHGTSCPCLLLPGTRTVCGISRRSTKHRRQRRLRFDRHYTTEPNQTMLDGNLRWANSALFGLVWPAFTRQSETEPNSAVLCWHSYKCSCEWGIKRLCHLRIWFHWLAMQVVTPLSIRSWIHACALIASWQDTYTIFLVYHSLSQSLTPHCPSSGQSTVTLEPAPM